MVFSKTHSTALWVAFCVVGGGFCIVQRIGNTVVTVAFVAGVVVTFILNVAGMFAGTAVEQSGQIKDCAMVNVLGTKCASRDDVLLLKTAIVRTERSSS